jgi:hypothetical protein
VARLAAANGDAAVAARLAGAAAALRERMHVPLPPSIQENFTRHIDACRVPLGDDTFQDLWESASHLSLDDVSAEAMAYLGRLDPSGTD